MKRVMSRFRVGRHAIAVSFVVFITLLTMPARAADIVFHNSQSAASRDPSITTSPVSGCYGDTVSVSILVDDTGEVEDFYFRLHYETSVLTFDNTGLQTVLTTDWAVAWSEISPGEIAVSGLTQYTAGVPIPVGSSGSILELNFLVSCACTEGQESFFTFSELSEGFTGYTSTPGVFTYTCSTPPFAHLVGGTATGQYHDAVSIPFSFVNSPNNVDAFGFRVSFCSDMLQYTGFDTGTLTDSWGTGDSDFGVNEITPGNLVIGGWSLDDTISQNSNGSVVILHFSVVTTTEETCELGITDLTDDIAFWGTSNGQFDSTLAPVPATGPASRAVMLLFVSVLIVLSFKRRG